MTYLVERLADLRGHLDHLRSLPAEATDVGALEQNRSLRNDVLFSLLGIAQLVIDMAGELAARRGVRFEDYTEAVRRLGELEAFPHDLVEQLVRLPGFRNVLIHEYVELDLARVIEAVQNLEPVDRFVKIVAGLIEAGSLPDED